MALEITGNIELLNGIELNSVYLRTIPKLNENGDTIIIMTQYWTSEAAYNQGKDMVSVLLPLDVKYPYNRNTDGTDLLLVSNEILKDKLEELGFSVVITGI